MKEERGIGQAGDDRVPVGRETPPGARITAFHASGKGAVGAESAEGDFEARWVGAAVALARAARESTSGVYGYPTIVRGNEELQVWMRAKPGTVDGFRAALDRFASLDAERKKSVSG